MSWDRIKATGRGKFSWRVVIAGCKYQFVSSKAMEKTLSDGRERIACIPRGRDLAIDQIGSPLHVLPEQSGVSIMLAETRDWKLTEQFYKRPTYSSWLSEDTTSSSAGIGVLDTGSVVADDILHIGMEAFKVGSVVDPPPSFGGCTRGVWDTDAWAHYSEDGEDTIRVEVTDWPRAMTGRQVFVYAYGEGDLLSGDGTLIWSGKVADEPELQDDGVHWQLNVDNTARVLGQVIGENLEAPIAPRGVRYHPGCQLEVRIIERSGTDVVDGSSDSVRFIIGAESGTFGTSADSFYESQDEFCESLSDVIDTALGTAGFASSPTIRAVPDENGWHFEVTIDGTTPRYIVIAASSPVDGDTNPAWVVDAANDVVETVIGGEVVYVPWSTDGVAGARTVPRGMLGPANSAYLRNAGSTKLYLGAGISASDIGSLRFEFPADGSLPEASVILPLTDANDSEQSATIAGWGSDPGRRYTAELLPELKPARVYVASGHVGDFVDALVTDAVSEMYRGNAPAVTSNDFNTSEWISRIGDMATRPAVSSRFFANGGEVELGDAIKHECRLVSAWIGFDSQGRMVPIETRTPVLTDPDVTEVEILRRPRPRQKKYGVGSAKGAIVKTGYQPTEDEWAGITHIIKDATALSRNPFAAMMEVEPRSRWHGGVRLDGSPVDATRRRDIIESVEPIISMLGLPYAIVTFDTSLKAMDVLLGDGVKFTPSGHELPNPDGTRDPVEHVGMVVARTIDFQRARIQLKVFVAQQDYSGYAPAFGVTGQTNVSGNTWDLTCVIADPHLTGGSTEWGRSTDSISDFISAGDEMQLYEWGVASPTVVDASVLSVSGSTVQVSASWTPGSSKWVLRNGASANLTSAQRRYARWANESGRLPEHDVSAGVFAP